MAYINTRDKNQKNTWTHRTIDGEVVRGKYTDREIDKMEESVDPRDVKWIEDRH